MPAAIVADALNFNMKFSRGPEDVGILSTRTEDAVELRAATGPRYGRIWDREVVDHLVDKFGDGVSGDWRVPGEFSQRVQVTKDNTTLYASDRDMFVFLADEENRIEIPGRRAGQSGSFARGFFRLELRSRQVCARLRFLPVRLCLLQPDGMGRGPVYRDPHSPHRRRPRLLERRPAAGPDRILERVGPARRQGDRGRAPQRIGTDISTFLGTRFGQKLAPVIMAAHQAEEDRPIETLWDASVGATAYARTIPNTDRRLEIERAAGALLKLAA